MKNTLEFAWKLVEIQKYCYSRKVGTPDCVQYSILNLLNKNPGKASDRDPLKPETKEDLCVLNSYFYQEEFRDFSLKETTCILKHHLVTLCKFKILLNEDAFLTALIVWFLHSNGGQSSIVG